MKGLAPGLYLNHHNPLFYRILPYNVQTKVPAGTQLFTWNNLGPEPLHQGSRIIGDEPDRELRQN